MTEAATELPEELLQQLQLPPTPVTAADVNDVLQHLTIPRRALFDEWNLYQLRIVRRILDLLQACLNCAQVPKTTLTLPARVGAVVFYDDTAKSNSLASWKRGLTPGFEEQLDSANFNKEWPLWGTSQHATFHFTPSQPLLCLLYQQQQPSYGQSWDVKSGAVSSDNQAAREQHEGRNAKGHVYVALLKDRAMFIYDPSFDRNATPAGTRINKVMTLNRARTLRRAAIEKRGKQSIQRIRLGGGGNEQSECLSMALEWMVDWVKWAVGYSGASMPDLEDGFINLSA